MNVASKSEGARDDLIEAVKAVLDRPGSARETLAAAAKLVQQTLHIDVIVIRTFSHGRISSDGVDAGVSALPLTIESGKVMHQGTPLRLPLVVSDVSKARLPTDLSVELSLRKIIAVCVLAIGTTLAAGSRGTFECYQSSSFRRWRHEELMLLRAIADCIDQYLDRGSMVAVQSRPQAALPAADYGRLARYGNVVILQTDSEFVITEAEGSIEDLLGTNSDQLLNNRSIWETLIDPRDRPGLRRKIARMRLERAELQTEIRIIHQVSSAVRWILLRALPRFLPDGTFAGWEGFGVDITDRRQAQEDLRAQNERLEALFEVSRVVQGHADPAFVALLGLRAVIRATKSACGYGVFLNRSTNTLELVAAHGLSSRYLEGIDAFIKQRDTLVQDVIQTRTGIVIDNVQDHPRAATELAHSEGLKSTIIMPLLTDSHVFGAIVTFKREARAYSELDSDLIGAAAVQIASAVRQAETFDEEKRRVRSAEALYRMSRELSKYRTPREIAEHAFPILQEEFSLKRIWFGVLNEQATHIAGKAGIGPGMRRQIQEVQIELSLQHDYLDEAIRTQKPVVVPEGANAECSGLNRLMNRLSAGTFMIYPLISLNQVIGILVLEPEIPATFFVENRLQLLAGMAGEMASVLLARRFESKMAEAGKMRMAGLLASGVAHNFNNLLQAILGQVALIEMNLPKGSQATSYTKTISEAAQRGASLVSQLLNFSLPGPASKIPLKVNLMLRSSLELYRSLVGRNVELTLTLDPEDASVIGDQGQLQQAITNLLANAKDAIGDRADGMVEIALKRVAIASGEVDPELSPGQYVRVDVKDNGEGMNPEQQARCFEPFFTTKNVDRLSGVGISGSGLGLSSAYSIIRQHDGIITIHSQAKEGTTVSIYLPIHESAAKGEGAGKAAARAAATGSGVLVLGLEPGVLPFTSSLFASLGYRTKSVFDGQQLFDLLRRAPDRWTGVLLDLDRLDENASKVAEQLAKEFPNVGVFCASAVPKDWSERLPAAANIELMDKPLGVWAVSGALLRLQERRGSSPPQPLPQVNNREEAAAQ